MRRRGHSLLQCAGCTPVRLVTLLRRFVVTHVRSQDATMVQAHTSCKTWLTYCKRKKINRENIIKTAFFSQLWHIFQYFIWPYIYMYIESWKRKVGNRIQESGLIKRGNTNKALNASSAYVCLLLVPCTWHHLRRFLAHWHYNIYRLRWRQHSILTVAVNLP